jgi:hypothetical protein
VRSTRAKVEVVDTEGLREASETDAG